MQRGKRVILHADANCFYASVECLYHPEYRGRPLAVCGDPEARHGIVLTATYPAKRQGVKTGMAIWQAKQACPSLIVRAPDYSLYKYFSELMGNLWREYTDHVEPFGLDESWLDVSAPGMTIEKGGELAEALRQRVKDELGLTVSIGVADNKVFAKLGSDLKKPDGTTVILPEQVERVIWPLPVSDLLYVGPATFRALRKLNILTIGHLAQAPDEVIDGHLGVNGMMLKRFALGLDRTPVREATWENDAKSIGNSITPPRDILTAEDALCVLTVLCESVGARLREHGLMGRVLTVSCRDTDLHWQGAQTPLTRPTFLTDDLIRSARELFRTRFASHLPARGLGVCCSSLCSASTPLQTDVWDGYGDYEKHGHLDRTVDELRGRYGADAVIRGTLLTHPDLSGVHPKDDHTVYPVPWQREVPVPTPG
ncbi:MAG: DNA polymerase IV [Clostridiales bacterium]|nr:DNA polymerase IV [Clostridiales bacterium]